MGLREHMRRVAVVILAGLAACGPEQAEQPPENWFVGEWFRWGAFCPEDCRAETLVQVEVAPDGTAIIFRESVCNEPQPRDELEWVQQESDLLRFEPVEPNTYVTGLQMPNFDYFTLRYEDECRAVGEEATKVFPLRRGPVKLALPEPHDCQSEIVPEDESTDVACLEAE